MSRVVEEVRKQTAQLTGPGLVAVSGGPDSVALLRAMKEACPVPFTVLHVNHKLRGEESEEDQAFVLDLADHFGLRFAYCERPIDTNVSIEVTAREQRYEWFRDVAISWNCTWIATGHTSDDQVETILHRIIRGTGIQGLEGIQSPGTAVPGLPVYRPLLQVSRQDILNYLSSLQQSFRTDSSNTDPKFTRNRIRHELLPLMRELNPEVRQAVQRLSDQAKESSELIDDFVVHLLDQATLPKAGEMIILDRERLELADSRLVRELFRKVWQTNGWAMGNMTAELWTRLGQLTPGDYPGGITVKVVGKVVQLSRKP